MEAFHAQMDRFVEGKEFETDEELNEAINREFVGRPADELKYPPRTPLEEAQDLCFRAFDSVGRRRIALARQALNVCPDCADAYVLLAEHAFEPEKAAELYAAGAQAGRRALGVAFFQENVGDFWDIHQSRPFMRALAGLAQCQMDSENLADAAATYRELLRLNPNDNQGNRFILLPLLIATGQDDQATEIVDQYPEEFQATWPYCRALLAFRREGDTPEADKLLKHAIRVNRHLPRFLTGKAEPDYWPESYGFGSEEEAIICIAESGRAWQATPGAIDWLRTSSRRLAKQARQRKTRRKRKQ
ncbi:MAG: hypothetical protein BIFFINMI_03952 [Phycisphaerae bacterium]|nr:hypothetical protein [Phycisphaerae bacterium]